MSNLTEQELVDKLHRAYKSHDPISQLSLESKFNLAGAYSIQKSLLLKMTEEGDQLTGYKLGFTSKAKMEQMGVHELIWGRLTDSMFIQNGGELNMNECIHPRAEPEIAFLIGTDISGPIKREEALSYIEGVTSAIEIIDSRYKDFKFSLEDVIADNCSSSGYVLGDWCDPQTEIGDLHMQLIINGETVQEGSTHAILGHPINSLIEASKILTKYGVTIKKGMILLAGAATPAVYLNRGDHIELNCTKLNSISLAVI